MPIALSIRPLRVLFFEVNVRKFSCQLPTPELKWNNRLRAAAGRFTPVHFRRGKKYPSTIEISSYLVHLPNSKELIKDTMAHEMIHYLLWCKNRPYGHTPEFRRIMKTMGVSRYNPAPAPSRSRNRYIYECPGCREEYFLKRKMRRQLACAKCCKSFSHGKFHQKFKLNFKRDANLDPRTPGPIKNGVCQD